MRGTGRKGYSCDIIPVVLTPLALCEDSRNVSDNDITTNIHSPLNSRLYYNRLQVSIIRQTQNLAHHHNLKWMLPGAASGSVIMSEIIDAIKDAVNPKRREQATVSNYDAQRRGPYTEQASAGASKPGPLSSSEAQDPGRTEQTDLSRDTSAAAGQHSGSIFSKTLSAAEESGRATQPEPSPKSRINHTLHSRADADRGSRVEYGPCDYGGAAAKPVHKEGGKYGLS